MQFMRRTLNSKEEVPFCTFCKTKDKRDSRNLEERKRVAAQSQSKVAKIIDQANGIVPNPKIDNFNPFWQPLNLSRRAVSQRNVLRYNNLQGAKKVLVFGVSEIPQVAFVAEANNHVTVFETRKATLRKLNKFKRAYLLDNVEIIAASEFCASPMFGAGFDLILLSPLVLYSQNRDSIFYDLSRVLKPNGKVFIQGAHSVGSLLQRYTTRLRTASSPYHVVRSFLQSLPRHLRRASAAKRFPAAGLDAVALNADNEQRLGIKEVTDILDASVPEILRAGPQRSAVGNFLTIATLEKIARQWPLRIDKLQFPICNRIGGGAAPVSYLEKDLSRLADLLENDEQMRQNLIAQFDKTCRGIESNIIITLVKS
jgi:hypothetical protein